MARWVVVLGLLGLGSGMACFLPSRPLYMSHQAVEVPAAGVTLRGTLSVPRWASRPVPGIVIVHGSGPLTRTSVRGDVRRLVRMGFAVLAYDKRGVGASEGTYIRSWGDSATTVLGQLAADAAAMHAYLRAQPGVDSTRTGYFGASQAGWIIPLASTSGPRPAFNVILSGPAVSTGVEHAYSDLTGDGRVPDWEARRGAIEAQVRAFTGPSGYDPRAVLTRNAIPTLWVLGDRDESVPTFRTVEVLAELAREGNRSHHVVRFPRGNHGLFIPESRTPCPLWDVFTNWMGERGIMRGVVAKPVPTTCD